MEPQSWPVTLKTESRLAGSPAYQVHMKSCHHPIWLWTGVGRPEEALTKDRKNTEERRLGMSQPAFLTTDPTETAGARPAAGPSLHCTRPRVRNQSKQSLTLCVTPLGQHSLYLFLPDRSLPIHLFKKSHLYIYCILNMWLKFLETILLSFPPLRAEIITHHLSGWHTVYGQNKFVKWILR